MERRLVRRLRQDVLAAGSRLVALDSRSGARRWTGGSTTQCGSAAGDTVYAAAEDRVTAYAFGGGVGAGGARHWTHAVVGRPEQGLAVADGAVILLTEDPEEGTSKAYALEEV